MYSTPVSNFCTAAMVQAKMECLCCRRDMGHISYDLPDNECAFLSLIRMEFAFLYLYSVCVHCILVSGQHGPKTVFGDAVYGHS